MCSTPGAGAAIATEAGTMCSGADAAATVPSLQVLRVPGAMVVTVVAREGAAFLIDRRYGGHLRCSDASLQLSRPEEHRRDLHNDLHSAASATHETAGAGAMYSTTSTGVAIAQKLVTMSSSIVRRPPAAGTTTST